MKTNIHPKWYDDCQVSCACGNQYTVGSTKQKISVDICSKCHPFFTGEMRFVDTLGRVERFQALRASGAQGKPVSKKQKKLLKKQQEEAEDAARPKTIREMLERVKARA